MPTWYLAGNERPRGPVPAAAAPTTPMSLVLASASSQYLTRNWSSSPASNQMATLAFWVKYTSTPQGSFSDMYDGGIWGPAGSEASFRVDASSNPESIVYDGSSVLADVVSDITGEILDTTTWHHYCVAYDSANGTAAARLLIYLDGVQVTYSGTSYIPLNGSYHLTDSGVTSAIGRSQASAGRYFNAKFAYFYFIDNAKLTPSSFTTGTGGSIHPIAYSGGFGTNGFFLDFRGSDTTDQSGLGNHWTQNNAPTFSSDIPT